MKIKNVLTMTLAFLMFAAASTSVDAQSYVVVTPSDSQGWTTADTTAGGMVQFVVDESAPRGMNALRLTTDSTTTAKAQYMHAADTQLDAVTDLSYYTKQVSASFAGGSASYQLVVCLEGGTPAACNGFTTLVFEPYQNPTQGPVVNGVWQQWDVDSGLFWSTRTYDGAGACDVTAGGGGAPFYTLAGLNAACPNAVVIGFGVNVGSNNPSYDINVDLVQFNNTIYDFQRYRVPSTKQDCKGGGWRFLATHTGDEFRNQGLCVAYFNHHSLQNGDILIDSDSISKP